MVVDFLKRTLKGILIDRQHRRYEREVKAKNLTYDGWIRKQEKNVLIAGGIDLKGVKCLTNDFSYADYDGEKVENDGNHSKNDDMCRMVKFIGSSGQNEESNVYLCVPAGLLYEGKKGIENILEDTISDVIVFTLYDGEISEIAYGLMEQCFRESRDVVLVYGDEDVIEEGIRRNPWFKPDWSPDRFLDSFYFGALVAVKRSALQRACECCKADGILERWQAVKGSNHAGEFLYLLLYKLLEMEGVFAKRRDGNAPVRHIRQVLYHSRCEGWQQIKKLELPEFIREEQIGKEKRTVEDILLSVVIPSKDNPEVLFHCLDSFVKRTKSSYPCELILVDNGSREENRKRIEKKVKELNQNLTNSEEELTLTGCTYLYRPMKFNFSEMCNIGAKKAKGKVLFFLNDDMEIIQPDWMERMMEKVLLSRVGVVGAKLLYPDSDMIQHAGITNLRVGPAHKLQFLEDGTEHYFGMNRGVHNMLAATGACLMVRREVFAEAGGFCTDLAVAFNDVDLCYTIFEHGYDNIVRNDVVFYHHESLSRGKDGESPDKQLRLLKEKDILYERHQGLYGKDPYYHPYLTTDMLETKYTPACQYQVTLDMPWADTSSCEKEVEKAREDKCLVVGMECAMDIYKWQYGVTPEKGSVQVKAEEMGFYFQGYSFVIGADNACYKKKLLLRNQADERIWMITVKEQYRKDIKDNLKDQLNVDLTGFTAKMRREAVPAGVYQFGMLCEDRCSRQKLVNWSNWVLEVKTDGKK